MLMVAGDQHNPWRIQFHRVGDNPRYSLFIIMRREMMEEVQSSRAPVAWIGTMPAACFPTPLYLVLPRACPYVPSSSSLPSLNLNELSTHQKKSCRNVYCSEFQYSARSATSCFYFRLFFIHSLPGSSNRFLAAYIFCHVIGDLTFLRVVRH